MTNREIINAPSIAYYSGLNGLEVKRLEFTPEPRVLCVSGCWHGGKAAQQAHRVSINYTRAGRAYFRVYGRRVYLDECIRMEAHA